MYVEINNCQTHLKVKITSKGIIFSYVIQLWKKWKKVSHLYMWNCTFFSSRPLPYLHPSDSLPVSTHLNQFSKKIWSTAILFSIVTSNKTSYHTVKSLLYYAEQDRNPIISLPLGVSQSLSPSCLCSLSMTWTPLNWLFASLRVTPETLMLRELFRQKTRTESDDGGERSKKKTKNWQERRGNLFPL